MTETRKWYERFYGERGSQAAPWYEEMQAWLLRNDEPSGQLLELGCGRGELLRELLASQRFSPQQLFAIEQSEVATTEIRKDLPNVTVGDLEAGLPFSDESFDCAVMAEVIEHLPRPDVVLREISRVLRPGGYFIMSFPNYVHIPWLIVRYLAAWLNKPNWIVLQPIDHVFFYPFLRSRVARHGFAHKETIGSVYFPPVLYRLETQKVRGWLNQRALGAFSFHPVLVFRKQ